MSLGRYAVYRKEDGLIVNCIIYDGTSPYQLDEGLEMEFASTDSNVGIGWTYDFETGKFSAPVVEEEQQTE